MEVIKQTRKYTVNPNKPPGRPKGSFKYTDHFINELGHKLLAWMKEPTNFWLGKFCSDNGLWQDKLSEFSERNEVFAQLLKRAKQIQQDRIVLLSMARKIDTTMAIFALKNVAGWRDKFDIDQKSDINITITQLVRDVQTYSRAEEETPSRLN